MSEHAHSFDSAQTKGSYAKKAKVLSFIEIARAAGLDVAGFKVAPDGSIEILSAAAFPAAPRDEFEAWDQAGKLG